MRIYKVKWGISTFDTNQMWFKYQTLSQDQKVNKFKWTIHLRKRN